ncbi:MAG TPA: PIN domain-containing protein [Thermoanaerobaculia bacterium]|nr:PIN domain-containing protein [Thermoanaerobaculia bacterium]
MPRRTFVDSLFVIALVNRRDQYHRQASALAASLRGEPLLTTDAVLLEIGNGLARSHKKEAVAILEELRAADELKIVSLTPDLFERAFHLYKTRQDKEWGLVDCVSFVVMKDEGVQSALTFDRHFRQAGFEALMQEIEPT